jgi:hypothetical protein
VLIDNKDLTERLTIYTGVIPAYIALRESIGRIIEEETETVDKNQLKLEL